jgi:hypothetical protein
MASQDMPTNTPQDAKVRTGGADSIPSGAPAGSPEREANARVLKRKAPQPREQGATLSTPGFPAFWSIAGSFALVVVVVIAALIAGPY